MRLHRRVVAGRERDHQEITALQDPYRPGARAFARALRFVELIQPEVRAREVRSRLRIPRIQPRRVACFGQRLVVLAGLPVVERQVDGRVEIARIGLLPQRQRFERPIEVARHALFVRVQNREPLVWSDAFAELIRPAGVLRGDLELRGTAVNRAQPHIGEREFRIELGRPPEESECLHVGAARTRSRSVAERLQGFERRGRRLLQRPIEPADRCERFSQCRAKPGCSLRHLLQDVFLPRSLHLLAREDVA